MDRYMTYFIRKWSNVFLLICFVMFVFFYSITAEARLVEDVTIDTVASGYEVKINFELLIRYQSHTPDKASNFITVDLGESHINKSKKSTFD